MRDPAAPSLLELLRDPVPLVAVSFDDQATAAEIATLCLAGLDVAELRIDRYRDRSTDHVVAETRRYAALPTIATIRTREQGGEWDGSDDDRVALFEAVLPEVAAVDVELSSVGSLAPVIAAARAADRTVIVSDHDFERMPAAAELESIVRRAQDSGAHIVKIAAMARSGDDVRTMAAFTLEHAGVGLITIAMGEHGMASRVFFPALGSALTFAFGASEPVSGQLTFADTMAELRRFYPEFDRRKRAELAATVE